MDEFVPILMAFMSGMFASGAAAQLGEPAIGPTAAAIYAVICAAMSIVFAWLA